MAEKSVNRLSQPKVARQLQALRRLLRQDREGKLRMGDVLVRLIDDHQLRPIDIARAVKERANHLSEMHHVSRMFPRRLRHPLVPYTHYWLAMRVVRRFPELKLNPLKTLAEIAANGFTQHRQVTSHFAVKMRQQEARHALAEADQTRPGAWHNRCYHARFQDLLNVIPDKSIKLLNFDPPYANYRRVRDGRYAAGSVSTTQSDNPSAAEAIAITVDLLRDWPPKVMAGGVLLLWQASGPLRDPIGRAITQHGWKIETVVIWDKGNIQPGNFARPYSTQTEWLWIIKLAGDRLINHDNSSRADVLRFAPPHLTIDITDREHAFEKPLELCEFLVAKHSHPSELVVDFCACTGSMALAAARLGRRWIYCESNHDNFQIGARRLSGRKSRWHIAG